MNNQEKKHPILRKFHNERMIKAWHTRKKNMTPEELKAYFSKLGKAGNKKRWSATKKVIPMSR